LNQLNPKTHKRKEGGGWLLQGFHSEEGQCVLEEWDSGKMEKKKKTTLTKKRTSGGAGENKRKGATGPLIGLRKLISKIGAREASVQFL